MSLFWYIPNMTKYLPVVKLEFVGKVDLHLHERPVHLAGHPIGWTASTQVLHFDIPCLIKTMSLHQDCVAR